MACGAADPSENVVNATGCVLMQAQLPECQDALDIAYSTYGNTLPNKLDAQEKCTNLIPFEHLQRNFYDRRIKVNRIFEVVPSIASGH